MGSFIVVLIAGILMGYLVYAYVNRKISKKMKILILANVLLYVMIYIIEGIQMLNINLSLNEMILPITNVIL